MYMFYEFDIFTNSRKWPKFRQFRENYEIGLSYKSLFHYYLAFWSQFRPLKISGGGGGGGPPSLILQKCVIKNEQKTLPIALHGSD